MHDIKNRPHDVRPKIGGLVSEAILPEPNLIQKVSRWSMDFRQLEPGPMNTHIRARDGQIVSLLEISMNRGVHQQGTAPPDTLTFGVPVSNSTLRWKGKEMRRGQCLTFGAEDGFEGLSDFAFHGVTISASNSDVDALADRIGVPVDKCARASGVIDPVHNASQIRSMSESARGFLSCKLISAMGLGDEEDLLISFLQVAASNKRLDDQSSSHQRARTVRVALEFMQANAEDNVPISQICAASRVSIRTLNRAFREAFGIGPKAYFLRMRLGLLRRALVEGNEPMLVSDLANPLGFWHMGQLARDYRAQFGELPSETRN